MATAYDRSAFDRATDPTFGLLTQEQARAIVEFRGDDKMARRLEKLAAKCNEGELTDEERAEYEDTPTPPTHETTPLPPQDKHEGRFATTPKRR